MNFNTEELYVLRSYLALGQEPTQADLEDAAQFNNIRAFSRDLVSDNTQTNEAFVTGLYENLLDRTPEEEEVQWWAEQMDQGLRSLTKAQIMLAFQDAAASEDGGVANAKVEALGLETIGLEFGTGQDDDNGDVEEPVDVDFDLNFTESSSAQNNIWSIGREAIDNGQATLSNQYTLSLRNQLNEDGGLSVVGTNPGQPNAADAGGVNVETYNAYFLSPLLSNIQTSTTQSELVLEVIDRHAETNEQALEFMAVQSFNFFYDGENIVVSSEAILNASTYEELRDAIAAALAADGRGDDFNVRLGGTFERQQTDPDTQEFTGARLEGREIIIEATGNGEIVRGGFETGAKPNANQNIDVAARMDDSAETTLSTALISTNVELQNIGYGSQGAALNVSGQSHSNVAIQELKVDAQAHSISSLGVWLTSVTSIPFRSENHGLESIELSGSSPYFNVGRQQGEEVVRSDAGLTDVREFAASGFGGDIQLDATITSDIIERDFDLVDTHDNAARDNTPAEYNLGRGDDRLLMDVAVEALAHEDFALNINTGAGDDYVHLRVTTGDNGALVTAGNQFDNHQDLENITIEARSGNNIIWTEGAGNATITTGGGRDTIYSDNSGSKRDVVYNVGTDAQFYGEANDNGQLHAHWILNAGNQDITDLRGEGPGTPAVLYGTELTVTFSGANGVMDGAGATAAGTNGFESTVTIPTTGVMGDQRSINQAIKQAINEDAVLSKLLVAKDGPYDALIIESLIDGEFDANAIRIDLTTKTYDDLTASERTNILNALRAQQNDSSAYPDVGTQTTAINDALAAGFNDYAQTVAQASVGGVTTAAAPTTTVTVGADSQTYAAGVDAEQTLTITGAATADGTVTVGGVTVNIADTDDADTVATKIKDTLDAHTGDINFGTTVIPADQVTVTRAGAVLTFEVSAANILGAGVTAAGNLDQIVYDENSAVTGLTAAASAGTDGTAATPQQQTIQFTAGATNEGTLVLTINGDTVVVPVDASDDADAIATKAATAITDAGVTNVATATATTDTVTITYELDQITAPDAPALTSQTGVAVGEFITGSDSTADTDNVINSGAGDDVIVLSTSDEASETIVFNQSSIGHNTIVNFDATNDVLDFTAYLTSRVYTDRDNSTSSVSQDRAPITLNDSGTNATVNSISVLTFEAGDTENTATAGQTWEALTAQRLVTALNGETTGNTVWGDLNGGRLNAVNEEGDNAQAVGSTLDHLVLVHNTANEGEYKVFKLQSSVVADTHDNAGNFNTNGASLIGTIDFGADVTFAIGNLEGVTA